MATSAPDRQRAYRERAARELNQRRINTWVNAEAVIAIERLARHWNIPKRQVIERLAAQAQEQVTDGLDDAAFEDFLRP